MATPVTPAAGEHTYYIKPKKPFDLEFPLSILDSLNPPINSRSVLIYKNPENAPEDWREDLVDRLQRSLQILLGSPDEAEDGTLVIPKLLATVIPDPESARLTAKITKESAVRFVVRYQPDFNYAQLRPDHDFPTRHVDQTIFSTIHEGLPPLVDGKWEGFAVQVTFVTGGFTILISKHHFLVDGGSTGNLVKWWFGKARELQKEKTADGPIKFEPAYTKAILDSSTLMLDKKVEPKEHMEWTIKPNCRFPTLFGLTLPPPAVMYIFSFLSFLRPKVRGAVFHFSASKLKELQNEIKAHTDQPFSTHDAVVALTWRCVTRARYFTTRRTHLLPEKVMMSLSVNCRHKLEPPLHNDYFGNAAVFGPSQLPASTLTATGGTTLGEIALSIRDAINNKTTDGYVRSICQLTAQQPKITDVVNSFRTYNGYDMVVTSWMAMFKSLDDLDVGVGKFQRMRQPGGSPFDGVAVVMPSYGVRGQEREGEVGDFKGGMEVSLDLLAGAMDHLLKDPEWNKYARYTEA